MWVLRTLGDEHVFSIGEQLSFDTGAGRAECWWQFAPVALITGLFFGELCCGKHTIMPMPLDTADHVQDLCGLRTHSQCSYWETVSEERDLFHERYNRQPL